MSLAAARPAHLGRLGQDAWDCLTTLPWLAPTDLPLISRYCLLLDRYERLSALVDAEGETVTSTKGTQMIHPAMRELRNVEASLLAMEKELGATPRARRLMDAPKETVTEDALDVLLRS